MTESSTAGQITDEGLARLRATIGIAVPHPQPPHYRRPNEDTFRIVAESYGDANPLWSDPEYATKSVWGEPIAPPPLIGGGWGCGTAMPMVARNLARPSSVIWPAVEDSVTHGLLSSAGMVGRDVGGN
ncbi:hypothetical protein A5633_21060 [Mycolicibacterium elephantis]|nr:hypothetical protein A5633_21060 [Mycolicibacterium elephantis]